MSPPVGRDVTDPTKILSFPQIVAVRFTVSAVALAKEDHTYCVVAKIAWRSVVGQASRLSTN